MNSESKGNLSVFLSKKKFLVEHLSIQRAVQFYPTLLPTNASRKLTPQNASNKPGSDQEKFEPCTLIMYQIKETAIKIKADLSSMWQLY